MESVRLTTPHPQILTNVTKTVIHRLDARGGLQKGVSPIDTPPPHVKMPTLQQKKHVYSLVQKVVLVYIANFVLHDNCEGVNCFITHPLKLY